MGARVGREGCRQEDVQTELIYMSVGAERYRLSQILNTNKSTMS